MTKNGKKERKKMSKIIFLSSKEPKFGENHGSKELVIYKSIQKGWKIGERVNVKYERYGKQQSDRWKKENKKSWIHTKIH